MIIICKNEEEKKSVECLLKIFKEQLSDYDNGLSCDGVDCEYCLSPCDVKYNGATVIVVE